MKQKLTAILLLLFLFAGTVVFARQVEIAVSSNVEAEKFSEDEIKKYGLSSGNPLEKEIIRKENAVTEMFENKIKEKYYDILKKLGSNKDIRFVPDYDPATTNFILRISFSIMVNEIPMDVNVEGQTVDGEYIHGIYFIRVIFQLEDPHTNGRITEIVDITPQQSSKYKHPEHVSAERLFNNYWNVFLTKAVPRANADAMSKIIKSFTVYNNVWVSYKALDNEKPKADGKQKGYITIKMPEISGEAKRNSITNFVLKCEKGTFLKTGTKEMEFSGADCFYENFGGRRIFKTKYKTYDCKDYEKDDCNYDVFTVVQKETMQEQIDNIAVEKKVNFQCERKYDVYAYYNAPGYVKAAVVWRDVTIRFPAEGQKPQELVYSPEMENMNVDEIKGTDGKPLKIPFSMKMPGYGVRTMYGAPENEYSTPEILYVTSLMKDVPFTIDLSHGALNSCEIVKINNEPVYLDLSFDLYMGNLPEALQNTVICWDPRVMKTTGHTFARYHFPTALITKEDIENFKSFEKVEKTLSNGQATLRVKFVPEE